MTDDQKIQTMISTSLNVLSFIEHSINQADPNMPGEEKLLMYQNIISWFRCAFIHDIHDKQGLPHKDKWEMLKHMANMDKEHLLILIQGHNQAQESLH